MRRGLGGPCMWPLTESLGVPHSCGAGWARSCAPSAAPGCCLCVAGAPHRERMEPLTLAEIAQAACRIAGSGVVRTPLVRLNLEPEETAAAGGAEVWLKLETLQPIGSFKLRGALNAMYSADPALLAQGVWTASTGNMAQGVAYGAKLLGVPCTVVTPDNAPASKLAAIKALGAATVSVPREEWFEFVVRTARFAQELSLHQACTSVL